MATGESPTQRAILVSLGWVRAGLWALLGFTFLVLGAALAAVGNIPIVTCTPTSGTSTYCATTPGVNNGWLPAIVGLGLLIYAFYRTTQIEKGVYEAEKKQPGGQLGFPAPSTVAHAPAPPPAQSPTATNNMPLRCVNCGLPLSQNAGICPSCGRPVR